MNLLTLLSSPSPSEQTDLSQGHKRPWIPLALAVINNMIITLFLTAHSRDVKETFRLQLKTR